MDPALYSHAHSDGSLCLTASSQNYTYTLTPHCTHTQNPILASQVTPDMRTFAFLTAILLVALQANAEPVPPAANEALGQERSEAEDQLMAISVSMDEENSLQDPGERLQLMRRRQTEADSEIHNWMALITWPYLRICEIFSS